MITLAKDACNNGALIRSREWLVTNGTGGYASSTVVGMNTRRYHGLLVSTSPGSGARIVLLSKLEEVLVVDGKEFPLSQNRYSAGVVTADGQVPLIEFSADLQATSTFAGPEWRLVRTVSMCHGQDTTRVAYQFSHIGNPRSVALNIRPLLAYRDYHATTHENSVLDRSVLIGDGAISVRPYGHMPQLHLGCRGARIKIDGYWYRGFEYDRERERGLDSEEDLFNPVLLEIDLTENSSFDLVASTMTTTDQEKKDPAQCSSLVPTTAVAFPNDSSIHDPLIRQLEVAASQFIFSRGNGVSTIAGYHWFGDWGRDTMISLSGLLLCNGRPEEAKEILLHYLQFLDKGMLPNRFPDQGDHPEYNTIDATLWLFEAIRRYVAYRPDDEWSDHAIALVRESFYQPLREIVQSHVEGTRFGIHSDQDGFLWGGDESTQLTWMDAKVGNVAFTPRDGRAVEIQALWYNALRILAEFARLLDDEEVYSQISELADRLESRFLQIFWNQDAGCLFDTAKLTRRDGSIRPNQIFPVSLHHRLVPAPVGREILNVVASKLLTPRGLRTCDPSDPQYRGCYVGDGWHRDSAYHQGTVWPWLIAPYFFAKLAVDVDLEKTFAELDDWLVQFWDHLSEAGLGQISEIFDGDPPHVARGCIAQAWSVSNILELARVAASRRHLCWTRPQVDEDHQYMDQDQLTSGTTRAKPSAEVFTHSSEFLAQRL